MSILTKLKASQPVPLGSIFSERVVVDLQLPAVFQNENIVLYLDRLQHWCELIGIKQLAILDTAVSFQRTSIEIPDEGGFTGETQSITEIGVNIKRLVKESTDYWDTFDRKGFIEALNEEVVNKFTEEALKQLNTPNIRDAVLQLMCIILSNWIFIKQSNFDRALIGYFFYMIINISYLMQQDPKFTRVPFNIAGMEITRSLYLLTEIYLFGDGIIEWLEEPKPQTT